VPVADLVREHGSPLFVYSEATLRAAYRNAHRAFTRRYEDVQFAWSYKTNYLNAICRVFHQEGSIAEVVSGFEYEKARHNGIPGHQILFNGPHKEKADLERAIAEGAMIQVDNTDELLVLADMARGRKEPLPIALRVHLSTGGQVVWTKFGFNGDDGEVQQIVRRIIAMPQLRLVGLHCHVGTFILEPDWYQIATKKLVSLALEAEAMGTGPMHYLNLGGGFASMARLHYQYLPPEQVTPSMDRYAEAISDTIISMWPANRPLPKLYLETGRALVDEAGYIIASVVAVKKRVFHDPLQTALVAYGKNPAAALTAHGSQNALVLDAGINLLYTSTWYQPRILPARACLDAPMPTTVYGCLCMNIDVIREEAPLPSLNTGDQVVMHPVGAYNQTQSMQFITYRPAAALVGEDKHVHVIRRRENLEYVQGMEVVPEHLRPA
ncbi:MAG: alanine racemase, partial [Roseimicrobium sp.]